MVFCLEEHRQEKPLSEEAPLLDEELATEKKEEPLNWIFASLSLVLLIYSTVTEQHLTQTYSR